MMMESKALSMVMSLLTLLLKTSLLRTLELDQFQVSLMLMKPKMEDKAMFPELKEILKVTKMVKIITTSMLN
jgi:hypothetical protein